MSCNEHYRNSITEYIFTVLTFGSGNTIWVLSVLVKFQNWGARVAQSVR
jgi:hypothetical protein